MESETVADPVRLPDDALLPYEDTWAAVREHLVERDEIPPNHPLTSLTLRMEVERSVTVVDYQSEPVVGVGEA